MSPEAVGQKTLKSIEFLSRRVYFLDFLQEVFRKGNASNGAYCVESSCIFSALHVRNMRFW